METNFKLLIYILFLVVLPIFYFFSPKGKNRIKYNILISIIIIFLLPTIIYLSFKEEGVTLLGAYMFGGAILVLTILIFIPFLALFVFRAYRMKKLALQYNLTYKLNVNYDIFASNESYKRNIIEGTLNSYRIKIWDEYNPPQKNSNVYLEFYNQIKSPIPRRRTVIEKNDEQIILPKSLFSSYTSISKIRNTLETIIDTKN
jgi:hypothetical protein